LSWTLFPVEGGGGDGTLTSDVLWLLSGGFGTGAENVVAAKTMAEKMTTREISIVRVRDG